jgi:hypothetical protein
MRVPEVGFPQIGELEDGSLQMRGPEPAPYSAKTIASMLN